MPSRSRKIFSLPRKLARSRSRSVAGRRQRLVDDGGGGGGEHDVPAARPAAPSASAIMAAERKMAATTTVERTKSPVSITTTGAVGKVSSSSGAGAAVVSPENPARKQHNPQHQHQQQHAANAYTAAQDQDNVNNVAPYNSHHTHTSSSQSLRAEDLNNDLHNRSTTTTEGEASSNWGSASGSDYFVSAFVSSSVPSFDKFDEDILSERGVFPSVVVPQPQQALSPQHQQTTLPLHHPQHPLSGQQQFHQHHQQQQQQQQPAMSDPYSAIAGPNGSYYSNEEEPQGVGPNGILWGESSVIHNDGEGDDCASSAMMYSQDFSADSYDPPAILIQLDDDDEEEEEDEPIDDVVHCINDDHEEDDDHDDAGLPLPVSTGINDEGTDKPEVANANANASVSVVGQGNNEWAFDSFPTSSEWNNSNNNDVETRSVKNRRLVSPSPVKPKSLRDDGTNVNNNTISINNNTTNDDDFGAWGGFAQMSVENSPEEKFDANEDDNVFGSNFFSAKFDTDKTASSGSDANVKDDDDDDDGFGTVEDAFFGNSWMDVGNNTNTTATARSAVHNITLAGGNNNGNGNGSEENDPWGEPSFADALFNYSMSNEESNHTSSSDNSKNNQQQQQQQQQQQHLVEEKKDDCSSHSSENTSVDVVSKKHPQGQIVSKVWDDNWSANHSGEEVMSHPLKVMPSILAGRGRQPQQAQMLQRQTQPQQQLNEQNPTLPEKKHGVVVTFDDSLTPPPATDLKVSQGSGSLIVTHRPLQEASHNGIIGIGNTAADSTISQQQRQQRGAQQHQNRHRRLNSNGSQSSRRSQSSKMSQQRGGRAKKVGVTGGSVGSSSSAVDQILEHYRQKRRAAAAAQQQQQGQVQVQHGGGGGGSVQSGASQFSSIVTPASSAAGGNGGVSVGTSNNAGVARNGSGGSSMGPVASGGLSGSGHSVGSHQNHTHPRSHHHHRRIPSGGSYSSHRRNPSSESISRIIDNLETAAAATGRPSAAAAVGHRAPSPSVGKYYPPNNANGFVGASTSGSVGGGIVNNCSSDDIAADHQFLLANIEATIGPRGVAPDMESLSGRSSSVRSQRSVQQQQQHARSAHGNRHRRRSSSRPHRSPTRSDSGQHGRNPADARSVDSRASRASRASKASRNSFRTYQSTRSALTTMSKETQSVANDLFRLEAQLAEQVARQQQQEGGEDDERRSATSNELPSSAVIEDVTYSTSGDLSISGISNTLGATPAPRSGPFQITAPPGKLGILLSNKRRNHTIGGGSGGPTHVSAVRSESVLAGKVQVGDVFVSIDGEDVSRMNSKEITNIMARKSEFERVLKFRPLADFRV